MDTTPGAASPLQPTMEEWLYDSERDRYFDGMAAALDWYDSWEHPRPAQLALCEQMGFSIDARSIVDDALVDHHENARDSINDAAMRRLQVFLDEWCQEQCVWSWFPTTTLVDVPRRDEAVL